MVLALVVEASGLNAENTATASAIFNASLTSAIGVHALDVVFHQGSTGRTVGKKAVGIRLVGTRTGRPIGALASFVRSLAHAVDMVLCGLGYLWPLWDSKRQTLADKIMGTVVVRS